MKYFSIGKSRTYKDTLKQQNKAFGRLDKARLGKEQSAVVDKAFSSATTAAQHTVQSLTGWDYRTRTIHTLTDSEIFYRMYTEAGIK